MVTNGADRKVIVITGASSGIGSALAVEYGRRGNYVGLLARREEALQDVASEIEATGGHALALAADVTDEGGVRAAVARIIEAWGHVDILIANAGIGVTTSALKINPSETARVVNTNLIGAVNSVAAVLPDMIRRKSGHLVAISSLAAYRGLPGSGAYCASKAGLSTFFESTRVDLKGSGIDVTTIHPGFIKTPLTAGRHSNMLFLMELDDARAKIMKAIDARRRTYAFPWQLATIVRCLKFLPSGLYDRFVTGRSFRE